MRFITEKKEFLDLLERANLTTEYPHVLETINDQYDKYSDSGENKVFPYVITVDKKFYEQIQKIALSQNIFFVILDINIISSEKYYNIFPMIQANPENDDFRDILNIFKMSSSNSKYNENLLHTGQMFGIFPESLDWIFFWDDDVYPEKVEFYTKKGGKSLEEYYFMMHGKPMPKE